MSTGVIIFWSVIIIFVISLGSDSVREMLSTGISNCLGYFIGCGCLTIIVLYFFGPVIFGIIFRIFEAIAPALGRFIGRYYCDFFEDESCPESAMNIWDAWDALYLFL